MALTKASGGGGSSTKGVAIKIGPTASGTVVYSVPAGKMFTGTIRAQNSSTNPFVLNGLYMYSTTDTNQFELGPGNVITTGSTSTEVVVAGIERNLV